MTSVNLVNHHTLNELTLTQKQNLLLKTFFHDEADIVAVNNSYDAKPMPAKPKSLNELLYGHLSGTPSEVLAISNQKIEKRNFRVGSYLVKPGSSVSTKLCIDLDGSGHKYPLADPTFVVIEMGMKCNSLGLNFHIERSLSGTGYHLWIFLDEPCEAKKVRELGRIISRGDFYLESGEFANVSAGKGIEIFPKQDAVEIGKFGNLVWLPWFHAAQDGNNSFYLLGGN